MDAPIHFELAILLDVVTGRVSLVPDGISYVLLTDTVWESILGFLPNAILPLAMSYTLLELLAGKADLPCVCANLSDDVLHDSRDDDATDGKTEAKWKLFIPIAVRLVVGVPESTHESTVINDAVVFLNIDRFCDFLCACLFDFIMMVTSLTM